MRPDVHRPAPRGVLQGTCPTCGQLKDYYIPRRTGTCLDCGRPIRKGTTILWTKGRGARHADCTLECNQESAYLGSRTAPRWNGAPVRDPGFVDLDRMFEDDCQARTGA